MKVECHSVSKRFQYQWIVKNCNWIFDSESVTGIMGPNGSGKSTLLRLISTQLSTSKGVIKYYLDNNEVKSNELYKYVSLVGPYTNLIEEFTLEEQMKFHFKFKAKNGEFDLDEFTRIVGLEHARNKAIGDFSSGMNQRLQLGLALLSQTSLLLLDEPTSFLDDSSKKWFYNLLAKYKGDRTVIIASNDQDDFTMAEEVKKVEEIK